MPAYPMQVLNGLVVPKPDRRAPSSDYDLTPRQFRRYVNASGVQDVQLYSGTQRRLRSGIRWPYRGSGWLYAASPVIPGQTRGNYGGFHMRAPDPLTFQAMTDAGPGSQPANPGKAGSDVNSRGFFAPGTG